MLFCYKKKAVVEQKQYIKPIPPNHFLLSTPFLWREAWGEDAQVGVSRETQRQPC